MAAADEEPKADDEPNSGGGSRLAHLVDGWQCYWRQAVFPAALALAILYMTVLGLDGITTGYAYSQGLKENVLAVARGVGAIFGISGSFAFPPLRRWLGLAYTGLFSLSLQLSCLLLCVVSIWLAGSPFDPLDYFSVERGLRLNNASDSLDRQTNGTLGQPTDVDWNMSIWVFVAGVVAARFGLWITDLAISQTMQESVSKAETGTVHGVQNSVQRFMDLLKNLLTIALPGPEIFGLLIAISWLAIFSAFVSYCVHIFRVRQHQQSVSEEENDSTNDRIA